MLHYTLCVVDFHEEGKLEKARDLLNNLLPTLKQEFFETPIYLKIKGMEFFGKTRSNVTNLHFNLEENQDFDRLKRLTSRLITALLDSGIVPKEELSFINYDERR